MSITSGGLAMSNKVSLAKVVDALDGAFDEHQSYLDPTSGEIVTLSEDELQLVEDEENEDVEEEDLQPWQRDALALARDVLESGRWVPLPSKFDVHEWAI